ncbi:hypothetical protein [Geminicoccus roseus]|uniref:hypothetical protein n=1 Tax=Geminicoccus roseus TaxID=404900 RepID=UPI00040312E0|nr:hypothetical protein [Geminicoccus roseus]
MTRTTGDAAPGRTVLDLQLASVFFPILLELAKDKRTITQTELVERARLAHPRRKIVQNADPLETGRRMEVVRGFTQEQGLPDLTCLVVQGDAEGNTDGADPFEARRNVFSTDWSAVAAGFPAFLRKAEADLAPKAKLTRDKAVQIMWEHYKANQAAIPKTINASREQIIADILEGFAAEDAFARALAMPVPAPAPAKRARR